MSIHRGFSAAGQLARRALVACAASSLCLSAALAPIPTAVLLSAKPSLAQTASPGPPITTKSTAQDPPARVGRIAKLDGTVSFHTADDDQWSPATLNYPLTSGNALWTEPGAKAELQIGSGNRLVMDGGTELNIDTLDDQTMQANMPQGAVYLHVTEKLEADRYAIETPRGIVQITEPGRYAITAGDADKPTTVTVIEGSAKLNGPDLSREVPAGQTASLTGPLDGNSPIRAALAPAQIEDAFVKSAMAEDTPAVASAPLPAAAPAAPPAPQAAPNNGMPQQVYGMTGAQDLARTGSWSTAPQYGAVWYPPVEPGWVPYRYGHWAYIPPWGWTWVADEPWGFAPFHYGRWVMVQDRWAWSPGIHVHIGYYRRPVYAPALVTFFGGSGWSVSISSGSVGWVPLGWREVYYPPYRVSRTYIRNVNITHVTNVTNITNVTKVRNVTINKYANYHGATVVPAKAMAESRPVHREARPIERQQLAHQRPDRKVAVQPTMVTAGMSPQRAQRMGIQADPQAMKERKAAPGPQIRQSDLRREDAAHGGPRNDGRGATSSRDMKNGPIQGKPQAIEPQSKPALREGGTPGPRPMNREQPRQQASTPPAGQDQAPRAAGQGHQRDMPQAGGRAPERPQVNRPQQTEQPQRQDMQRQQDLRRQEQQRSEQQQMQRRQEAQRQEMQRQEAQRQAQQQMQRQQELQRQQDVQRQHVERQQQEAQRQQQEAQRQMQMQAERQQHMQRQMQQQQFQRQQDAARQDQQQRRRQQEQQRDKD